MPSKKKKTHLLCNLINLNTPYIFILRLKHPIRHLRVFIKQKAPLQQCKSNKSDFLGIFWVGLIFKRQFLRQWQLRAMQMMLFIASLSPAHRCLKKACPLQTNGIPINLTTAAILTYKLKGHDDRVCEDTVRYNRYSRLHWSEVAQGYREL